MFQMVLQNYTKNIDLIMIPITVIMIFATINENHEKIYSAMHITYLTYDTAK